MTLQPERKKTPSQSSAEKGTDPHGKSAIGGRGPGGRGPGGGHRGMMPGDKAKDFRGSVRSLLKYLSKHVLFILIASVFAIGSTIFMILSPMLLGRITTNIFGGPDFVYIARMVGILSVMYGLSAFLAWLQAFLMSGVSMDVSFAMRNDIEKKLHHLPLAFFDSRSRGDILSLLTNDVDTVTQTLNQSLSQIITAVATLVGILIMMFVISWQMTLVALFVLPISLLFVRFIVTRSQPYFRAQQTGIAKLNGHIQEMYASHSVVRAFGGEAAAIEAFDEYNSDLYGSAWKSQFLSGLMMPVMTGIANAGYVAVALLGGILALRGQLAVGNIQAFIQYVRQFNQPITQVANISNVLQSMAAAAERIFAFLSEGEELETGGIALPGDRVQGAVEFDSVKFSYVSGHPVIRNFSAHIQPGMKVAIVGPTGAGKTTMVKLLMRFYDTDSGTIKIDGFDIAQCDRRDVRAAFGMVLQDTWLYHASVLENIRYGRLNATDSEVHEAAISAQADHFIRTLPEGYDFFLNEDATNISRGQKQLLTIARAILADPPVLILDEATSSVDSLTEVLIQKAMDNLMAGRTSFVIAHRLSTIRNADLILVMQDGDIVEQGRHDALLATGGAYADLYRSQFDPRSADTESIKD